MNKENPKVLNKFLIYLRAIKNYSPRTISGYNLDLLTFFKFILEYLNLDIEIKDINIFILADIKESHIIAFLVYLNKVKNNSPETRNRILSAIKSFYKYLIIKYSYFKNKLNPAEHIKSAEHIIKIPKYLNLEDAKKIQKVFNKHNSRNPIRNNAIITLFLSSAMRLSELANINIKDINFDEKIIKIMGKGHKERFVYLTDSAINSIKEYLSYRSIVDVDTLFLNNKNKQLSIYGIERICNKAFKLVGLEEYGYTTHSLRHTAATYIYGETKDILVVKEVLGHTSIMSTELYTHLKNDELKKAVEKNPLNNYKVGRGSS